MIISDLKILDSVPFCADDNKVITFDNETEQYNFFSSYTYRTFNDIMFVKGFLYKKIKLDVPYDEIKYCNYIMFKNAQTQESKWNYAYITGFEYISDACTYIEIEIDYFQTYMGEIIFAPSYIERQMARDDSLSNEELFIEEPELDLESYVITESESFQYNEWCVLIFYKANCILQVAEDTINILTDMFRSVNNFKYSDFTTGAYAEWFNYGGIYPERYATGASIKVYRIRNAQEFTTLENAFVKLETLGYSIISSYMVPLEYAQDYSAQFDSWTLNSTINPYYKTNKAINYGRYTYTPINNKCYTTPYIYLEISNFQGMIKKYSYQYFLQTTQGTPNFNFEISANVLGKFDAVAYPALYKTTVTRLNATYDYGIPIGDCPEVMWNSSWANTIRTMGQTLFNAIADTAMISAGMPPTNTLTASQSASLEKAQTQKQIRGAAGIGSSLFNNTDLSTKGVPSMPILQILHNKLGWVARQYATINILEIDQYFSMFGYRLNKYLSMNILGNARWNYIKVTEPIIVGEIPINARNYIINKLKDGVTFWHDKTNFSYGTFRDGYANTRINKELNNGRIFQN